MGTSPLTKDEWTERLKPFLPRSLQKVSERITNERHIQGWIREASYEAAQGLEGPSDMQAEAAAYRHLLDDLEASFPALLDAVRELTNGCGTVDIHWRPLAPNYTRLFINFGVDYEVHLFVKLRAASPDEVRRALRTVADALPQSEPFPNRPNTRAGLVALDEQCLGVRLSEHHAQDEQRRRTVTLLPSDDAPIRDLEMDAASEQLLDHLAPDPGSVSPNEWLNPLT